VGGGKGGYQRMFCWPECRSNGTDAIEKEIAKRKRGGKREKDQLRSNIRIPGKKVGLGFNLNNMQEGGMG